MYGLKIIDENFNQKLCLLEKLKRYMEETRFKFFFDQHNKRLHMMRLEIDYYISPLHKNVLKTRSFEKCRITKQP